MLGDPIQLEWGDSLPHSDSDNDEGVISPGCTPHINARSGDLSDDNLSGILSDEESEKTHADRRSVVASTPLAGRGLPAASRQLPNIDVESIPSIAAPRRVTRAMAKAAADNPAGAAISTRSPSILRGNSDCFDEMQIDFDGTYFFDDPTISANGPIDISLDLEHMRAYYNLGFFTKEPESLSPMELTEDGAGCLPSLSSCKVS